MLNIFSLGLDDIAAQLRAQGIAKALFEHHMLPRVLAGFGIMSYVADAAPGVAGRVAGSGTIVVLLAATHDSRSMRSNAPSACNRKARLSRLST